MMTCDLDYHMINTATKSDLRLSRGNLRTNPTCVCAVFVALKFHQECGLFVNLRSVSPFSLAIIIIHCLHRWEGVLFQGMAGQGVAGRVGKKKQPSADSAGVVIQCPPSLSFSVD